ncbi:MAG: peptidoglycan bridge formation glycyltransferase FemA/FemB family protein [Candidatus Komeilibacteria bacterium]
MRLVELYDDYQDIFNDFVGAQPQSQFLQSWQWGEFQRALNKKVWRLGIKQSNQFISTAQIVSHHLPMDKSYLYLPRGPIMMPGLDIQTQRQIIELYLSKARDIAYATKKENEIFLRLEPVQGCSEEAILPLLLQKRMSVQPQHTQILDLELDEATLLKDMHQKTRYNINLAKKKGVRIIQSNKEEDLNKFLHLAKLTAARANFEIWPDQYYHQMFANLSKEKMISVWLAEYEKETLVANLVINYGDTVTYLHGGSANKYKELMAPHLLQWQQILWARNNDYKYYDFWGIAPKDSKKEKIWQGITRFKQGFGGEQIDYPGTYDFIYNNTWYKLYNFVKKFR